MKKVNWQWLNFSEFDINTLYETLKIREDVFQLEQNSLYKDIDGLDLTAKHCLGKIKNNLCAYARVRKDVDFITIERILTHHAYRNLGLGKDLIAEVLSYIKDGYPDYPIIISAQSRLKKFYNNFGFTTFGDEFDDAGVMHIKMRL